MKKWEGGSDCIKKRVPGKIRISLTERFENTLNPSE